MSDPIEALCTVCNVRHGMPMCSPGTPIRDAIRKRAEEKYPRSPLVITPALFADLADKEKKDDN